MAKRLSLFSAALLLFVHCALAQGSALITNITATSGRSYVLGKLNVGVSVYSDRTYQATSVPTFLNSAAFIKTPNDDKTNKGSSVLSFNLTQSATVYVAYDPRATALPAWLNGWQKLTDEIGINDPKISALSLYSKSFPIGKITLGGNLASPAAGALNQYFVAATSQSQPAQYTLTVTTSGNGSVNKNPNQSTYASGTSVSLTANPSAGSQFTGWSGDASGTSNPLSVVVNSNKNITANFSPVSSALIININATSGRTYTLGSLTTGATYFSDRIYQATSVPGFLNNAALIKTPNDDKASQANALLSFDLTQSATVYVAYDSRSTTLPSWLSTWQKSASQIGINDPKVSFTDLYSKNFSAGKVTLGGNLASPAAGAMNNYFVAATSQQTQFTLTTTTSGNGTVTKNPNQASYAAGSSVTLTATPQAGSQFTGWSGDASGVVNPLTITINENKTITASFTSGSAPQATVTPLRIYDNDVSGGTAGTNRTVTVKNTGSGVLSLSSITVTGSNSNQFDVIGLPAFPKTLNAGSSITFSIAFDPTSTGLKTAAVNINSNDPANPAIIIPLRALGTPGVGGANEPSLQALLNLLEIGIDAGDDNVSTAVINSSTSLQKAPLLGDEVSLQKFEKAGSGPVTITPLAVFGPTDNATIVGMGWYKSGSSSTRTELYSVDNSPLSNGQTVNVDFTGTLSFDPLAESFGFYSRWPYFNNRILYSEDNLNTFSGSIPHHVRVYPYQKNGTIIPNSYLVAFEEHISGFDYQDILFVVNNVKPVVTALPASDALLFVENLDKFPANDHFVFSRIQIPWRRKVAEPFNANHDSINVRIHNKGIETLSISKLTLSNTATWKIEKIGANPYTPGSGLPLTITPGNFIDVILRFIALDQAPKVKVLHETLKITSNDSKSPLKTVFLHGIWQKQGEGSNEPTAQETIEAFNFKTKTGFVRFDPDEGDSTKLKGDEIKPSFFLRADPTLPVTVKQMSAYHGCCASTERLYWYPKGTTNLSAFYVHSPANGQTLLPRQANGSLNSAAVNINNAFGFKIGSVDLTDASKTPGKKIGIRVWRAINASGVVIPNAYIIANDYLGSPATNYDYNDNAHFVTNIKPEVGSAFFSALNPTPSALDFGEKVLQTNNTLVLDIKSLGKTYSNGSSDPIINIASVQIVGENSSEFLYEAPGSANLNPQQTTSITVRFKPVTQGLKIADLLIYYNFSPNPLRVPLYGIAKASGTSVTVHNRIAGGRSAAVTINGKTWSSDKPFAFDNLEPFKNNSLTQIAGTDDDALYLTEQSSNGEKKPFRFQIPVSNGNYVVRLHFAEIYWGAPGAGVASGAGSRVFNVKIENQYRLINFDMVQEVGSATAVVKNFPVTVTDGKINIDFSANVNRPMVSAVEVYSFSNGAARPAAFATAEHSLTLPSVDQADRPDFSAPSVYPNPLSSNTLNVQFPAKYHGEYTLQLIDMVGRKYNIGKTRISGGGSNLKVNISRYALKPGVYYLRIHSDVNKADVLKLLIE